ncbi:hypothetical protein [Pseudaestuariivita rosea]|uniref:hypothetical protein n=1 Tax=Pseudaestuariivita rosea TaxID=2763263 RepID=UPI001ABB4BF9|nr:hypothetical protein [Pseudaestuariivita rosea]
MDRLDDARRAARVEEYLHRAKRMTLELFGVDPTHDNSNVTVALATAMIHLEAADIQAEAQEQMLTIMNRQT